MRGKVGTKTEEKVIRPPMEKIASGKVFRPTKAFRNKLWFQMASAAVVTWTILILAWMGIAYGAAMDNGLTVMEYWQYIADYFVLANLIVWVVHAVWLVPGVIAVPLYVNSIEYSVRSETGETMPEIYVRKGIINITEKHVPFRTITNISSRAGPFDRMFGIGCVEIQTAGYSGGAQAGARPEENIEGIPYYMEVRDFILRELRKITHPYVTTTELVPPAERPAGQSTGAVDNEVLVVLREIRDLLRERCR